jgi:RNA polymerase sigma factor (sigma-70 family)
VRSDEIAAVVEEHRQEILRFVQPRIEPELRRRIQPDDVFQMVHERAQSRWAEFCSSDLNARIWLLRQARDALLDLKRRELALKRSARRESYIDGNSWSEEQSRALVDSLSSVGSRLARRELAGSIMQALRKKYPNDYNLLFMRHEEALSLHEIAAIQGEEYDVICQRHFRAIERLTRIYHRMCPPST